MNDPRAKMDGNNLLGMGAPRPDWSKTPGRVPGFWLTLAGFILAIVFPLPSLIVAVIGLAYATQAFRVIPAKARGRGLVIVSFVLVGLSVALALTRTILSLLP
ncbi:hypothetical protein [Cryobacterium psychrophilum]|uniref:Uncharacterized protein n=1 Tax=Cryobacterium psychrophilum TaxID=41988 RepID=A0A4Y8KT14_9MICO|nr:hypothetical protein [Cryobacterium psychrophilum]TDW28686.1 hypothetical protein EDD25_0313 [Cryobacterium psychrophilum]TFD82346.1 hypothetical protein E3T53_00245 [Cryobacterium psychrophilum]